MIIYNKIEALKNSLNNLRHNKKTIGFIPTGGALHQGHISLIEKAKSDCDVVVCSIFINPTQFNDLSDLEKYPKNLNADFLLLEKAKCDIVFAPEVNEIYSEEELELKRQKIEDNSWTDGKYVDFGDLDKVLEGAQRPGHFNGVAQVVSKLFRILEPDKAYFGQKDFQQLAIIRSMVKQLEMPIEIIAGDIIREPNGLAMSSRNERLTKEQRHKAAIIYETLVILKEQFKTKSVADIKSWGINNLQKEPSIKLEYLEIIDAATLQQINDYIQIESAVVCIAVKIGEVRLIDNMILY